MKNVTDNQPELYLIPVGELFELDSKAVQIAYAPLHGAYTLVDAKEAGKLQEPSTANTDFTTALKSLPMLPLLPTPPTTDDIWEVDLLLNNICNFHCSYCYSAAGRSNKRMPEAAWKKTVDFIFAPDKKDKLPVRFSFSGGGEPLISFPEIRRVVNYIEQKHQESGRPYTLGLVTNGSLLTDEVIEYIRDKKIEIVVSFEVLPELQNRERGSWDKVSTNLHRMHELGCPFGIRSPLTEDALPHLPAMLNMLAEQFPFIKSLVVEPVHSPEWYGSSEKLSAYFDLFFNTYTKAVEQAEALGIMLVSNAFSQLKYRRKAKCMCKAVVTAEGSISHCARVAASTEPLYDRFIYGHADTPGDEPLSFKQEMFEFINKRNIFEQPECVTCYARWNCGGDCSLFRQTYPAECYEVSCHFTKRCLVWEMLRNMRKQFSHANPEQSFEDYVRSSI